MVFSQDLTIQEKQFEQLQTEQTILVNGIDSLNVLLNSILTKVDQQKGQANPDKKKITDLMSEALSLSKEIEKREDQLNQNDKILRELKKDLGEYYSNKIADLQKQLDKNISNGKKKIIEQELFLLANKRLLVSPIISSINFNPEKINQINLKIAQDNFEKEILKDYLQTALANVDSNLNVITKKENQLEDAKRLDEKANIFAEDVANSRVIGVYEERSSVLAAESDKNLDYTGRIFTNRDAIENTLNQQNDLVVLANQLQQMGLNIDEKIDLQMIAPGETLSFEQYLELLKKSRDILSQYRSILIAKIESAE